MKGLILGLLWFHSVMYAWEDTPACYRELEHNFFTEKTAFEAFELFEVYQSTWVPLWTALKKNAESAPEKITQRAKQFKPNPLEYPFHADKAKEILVSVHWEIFMVTVNSFRIWDGRTINGMFTYIKDENEKRLKLCK